jgi:hypothetical protein
MAEGFAQQTLGRNLVSKVQRRRVDKSQTEGLLLPASVKVQVYVYRRSPYVGGMATATVHKLGDGRKLVFGGPRRDNAGVEEEAEE